MIRVVVLLLGAIRSAFRSHAEFALENLALRQQLAAFAHSGRRPRILATDRLFWIALRRLWSRWVDVLVFVKPETVIRCIAWASAATGRGCHATGVKDAPRLTLCSAV